MKISPLPRLFSNNAPYARHIGVIFGDPSLPDRVKPGGRYRDKDLQEVDDFLAVLEHMPEYKVTVFNRHATLWDDLKASRPELVVNLCDNGYNNNPRLELHIPAMLDMLGIPYTGASTVALGIAYDKALVGAAAGAIGVPVPREILISAKDAVPSDWVVYPAFVKPCCADNSVGITDQSVCLDRKTLTSTLERLCALMPGEDLLIQEFLPGTEYRVLLLGNAGAGYQFMPIMERDYSQMADGLSRFVTYEYKFDISNDAETAALRSRMTTLPEKDQQWLKEKTIMLAERFQCYDCLICDFRKDAAGIPRLIDLNPNPSWDKGSLIGSYDTERGYTYEDVIRFIIEAAQFRFIPQRKAA